ncbi:MAG: GMC family oxidoreductase N-terminal domain-containing protein [Proteobacteria bacterium]|nr:GMC family oxidoreductase N-terminal domain-containing protein [Pseudomonadota bacterium]
MGTDYDYVIVGAGSAGCVMASRLSAKPGNRVLLLEAGQDTPPGAEPADVLDTYPMSYFNPAYAWRGLRGHARRHDNSPAGPFRQGRIMGGTSSINGMVALRGTPMDYDAWAANGAAGWSWDEVLPYFRALENDIDAASDAAGIAAHGKDGPVPISRVAREEWPPFVDSVGSWSRNRQVAPILDLNSEFREGVGALPLTRFADKRASTAICYLDAETRARENLTIVTDAHVERLLMDGTRVTGVAATIDGAAREFSAQEVIICAGALQSPVMLLRAGIGPAAALRALDLPVLADRAGVGANLQNHPVVYVVAQLHRDAAQPAAMKSHSTATERFSSGVAGCGPLDMSMSISSKIGWHALGRRIGALVPTLLTPASRGDVTLARKGTGDADIERRIEFNYLDDERDRHCLTAGVRHAIDILLSPEVRPLWHCAVPISRPNKMRALNDITPFNNLRARILAGLFDFVPASGRPVLAGLSEPGVDIAALANDPAALDEIVGKCVAGVFHPAGTCRMGAPDDPMAVTDPQGRVYGVAGLRVVDASLMPALPRGNTNIPTIMMAEKISAGMLETA